MMQCIRHSPFFTRQNNNKKSLRPPAIKTITAMRYAGVCVGCANELHCHYLTNHRIGSHFHQRQITSNVTLEKKREVFQTRNKTQTAKLESQACFRFKNSCVRTKPKCSDPISYFLKTCCLNKKEPQFLRIDIPIIDNINEIHVFTLLNNLFRNSEQSIRVSHRAPYLCNIITSHMRAKKDDPENISSQDS